jgi:DNA topoisomerase I
MPRLRRSDCSAPGISRRRRGRGFEYLDEHGAKITDAAELQRIRELAIPPAWRDVWICADERGHIQATGRDARNRKQYRYHPLWRQLRDSAKYERTIDFAEALPRLRRRVRHDLGRRGLPREKVVAAVVRLLEVTLLRIGNDEYARLNRSFGLTTLRNRHATVRGSSFKLSFRGKGGRQHEVGLRDRRLARILRSCQELPGQRLFQYVDDEGRRQGVTSDDVNDYLRQAMGGEFTAKDFRTWAGTVLAAKALRSIVDAAAAGGDDALPPDRSLVRAVEDVAGRLGNTPAVCRSCYIHPAIIDAHLDGSLAQVLSQRAAAGLATPSALRTDERLVLRLLRDQLEAERKSSAAA